MLSDGNTNIEMIETKHTWTVEEEGEEKTKEISAQGTLNVLKLLGD
jgi:hypothetical protein